MDILRHNIRWGFSQGDEEQYLRLTDLEARTDQAQITAWSGQELLQEQSGQADGGLLWLCMCSILDVQLEELMSPPSVVV